MDTFFIKPAPGCAVRDPISRKLLKDDGEEKPQSGFWLRRIADDSVQRTKRKAAKKDPAKDPALPVEESAEASEILNVTEAAPDE
ncbi:TPA: DUF2635 domain-containing protein [Klebsiella pneumoniae]|uniref:DUF2635 domain-containing protein n=1 Tax=Klebsiella pneumoniae TaxID=573 RepID=UPI001646041C|nr:DUF2635 domain-containing protein [Klebsiella pneumoniae]EKW2891644.1 DUF2635 domain-containing protein [Klebsiella pneumoniae]ELA0627903.1 DUF2635 domain-containing protein [Klebsiella pneumoniae]MBC4125391.1 DUF2635 domain-containing protein [Klebsiella pneumoniae]MBX4703672.1 hypothetical protein [Klebsiella pneumoniae]MCD9656151.1 DUF2635 domain-containing protein [Klebsiella pneumoniae]